jgi:hypothetical protein
MFSLARTGAYGQRQSEQVETKIAFNAIKVLQMSNASAFDDIEGPSAKDTIPRLEKGRLPWGN